MKLSEARSILTREGVGEPDLIDYARLKGNVLVVMTEHKSQPIEGKVLITRRLTVFEDGRSSYSTSIIVSDRWENAGSRK